MVGYETVGNIGSGADFEGNDEQPFRRALNKGKNINVLPGQYNFASGVKCTSAVRVNMYPGSKIAVANSDTVGAFDFTADDTALIGGEIQSNTFVGGQILVRYSGNRTVIERTKFTHTAAGAQFIPTTPDVSVQDNDTIDSSIRFCQFLPNIGVRSMHINLGEQGLYMGNHFSSGNDATTFANFVVPARGSYQGIYMDRHGWGNVSHNIWRGLGNNVAFADGSGEVDACFVYQGTTGDALDTFEAGHLTMIGNKMEHVYCSQYFRILGCQWGDFVGNFMGQSAGRMDVATKGAIFVGGAGGTANRLSSKLNFVGGNIHNPAISTSQAIIGGYAIHVEDAYGCSFKNINITDFAATFPIHVERASVWGITFDNFTLHETQASYAANLPVADVPYLEGWFYIIGGAGAFPDESSTSGYFAGMAVSNMRIFQREATTTPMYHDGTAQIAEASLTGSFFSRGLAEFTTGSNPVSNLPLNGTTTVAELTTNFRLQNNP